MRDETRVKAAAVVLHAQDQGVSVAGEDERSPGSARVTGDVRERLTHDELDVRSAIGRELAEGLCATVQVDLQVDHRIHAQLFREAGEALDGIFVATNRRPQPQDVGADVRDDEVERVDRAVHPGDRLEAAIVLLDQLRDVLERQADGVDGLDDPVVEVLADALPLLDDRHTLHLVVEAGIVDGDAGVDGEHLDQALIRLGERLSVLLVRQVEIAHGAAVDDERRPQERRHLRVMGREPVVGRVGCDIGGPDRSSLADDEAEEAVTPGDGTDLGPTLRVDPAGDEPLNAAPAVRQPQRREPGPDQLPHAIDDQAQHPVDVQLGRDRTGGGLQRGEPLRPPVRLRARPRGVHRQLHHPHRQLRAVGRRIQEQASQQPVTLVGAQQMLCEVSALGLVRQVRQRPDADGECRQGWGADLEQGPARGRALHDALECPRDLRPGLLRRLPLPPLECIERPDEGKRLADERQRRTVHRHRGDTTGDVVASDGHRLQPTSPLRAACCGEEGPPAWGHTSLRTDTIHPDHSITRS